MRFRATALITAGVVIAGLTACSSSAPSPDASSEECDPAASGAASEAVTVTGELGAKPEVSFESPFETETTERTVVIEGDGAVAVEGSTVTIDFTMFNGASGEELTDSGYAEGTAVPFTVDAEQFLPGLVSTLQCATEGSRVVGVIPPAELFGEQGNSEMGVGPEDDLVFVADLISVGDAPLPRADGEQQELPDGFPAVELELADDGVPSLTLPDGEPPAELQIATVQKGEGAEVEEGDSVTVHYLGMNWATKEVFDDSWSRGAPASFPTNGVVQGFRDAIVGQTVGSQVIAVIPPALGYGEEGSGHELSGQTLVFVIDILATS